MKSTKSKNESTDAQVYEPEKVFFKKKRFWLVLVIITVTLLAMGVLAANRLGSNGNSQPTNFVETPAPDTSSLEKNDNTITIEPPTEGMYEFPTTGE